MSKVDWINWKTDKKEIIQVEKILEELEERFQEYNHYIHTVVYNEINYEIQNGGLSQSACDLSGISPMNEKAQHIIKHINEVQNTMTKFTEEAQKAMNEQKAIEKDQLITTIEEKILEKEKILENTLKLQSKMSNENPIIDNEKIMDIINNTEENITNLKKRLEVAQTI